MTATPLRPVGPDEKAPPHTVSTAAQHGSRKDLLVALRDRISEQVDARDCPPRDLSSLSRRLMEVVKEIESLKAAEEEDGLGDAARTPDEQWNTG